MVPFRLLSRWLLTLIAVGLAVAALVIVVLRVSLGQVERLEPTLVDMVRDRFNAEASLVAVDGALEGLDPALILDGLSLEAKDAMGSYPLLEIDRGEVRLDTLESLSQLIPVVDKAHFQGVTLHLYQDPERRWIWPPPARIPPELMPEGEFDLERLDFWVGVLLRQRAWVDDLRLVLHGQSKVTVLHAPRLLMTGDESRTHIEGEVFVEGRSQEAMEVVMSLTPGQRDASNFSAALQGTMKLHSLTGLSELFGIEKVLRFDEASGDATLWGRWDNGQLADVRLDVTAPRLALNQSPPLGQVTNEGGGVVMRGAEIRGQWLRRGLDDWEVWLEGDAEGVAWTGSDGEQAPNANPVPQFWHIERVDDGWWANASGFELAALAKWRERLRLPEGLARTVDSLQPRGRVTGLGFGKRGGEWQARVAGTGVEVSPWESAPGGGPLDIWVEADGKRGRVEFVDSGDASMSFPELFAAPMALDHASGEVAWSYDGPRSFVSGRDLRVGWQGAEVEGDFGLAIASDRRGGFGLTLDFRDVDARSRPLVDWLPMPLLRNDVDAELAEWLASGLAGRVPEGSLRIHVPLREQQDLSAPVLEPTLELDLDVVDGTVPYADGWPALENVSGHLALEGDSLNATVNHAESLGVETQQAEVSLDDDVLKVEGPLTASLTDLLAFLAAMPVEGADAAESWRGDGAVTGTLSLGVPMQNPEALSLTVAADARASQVEHTSTGLMFSDVSGPLTWTQEGEDGGLSGQMGGRVLGGQVTAELEGANDVIALSGQVDAPSLLDWAGLPRDVLLSGGMPWRGRLNLDAKQLSLDSTLEGLSIALPSPLGKRASATRPLHLDIGLGDSASMTGSFGRDVGVRWRAAGASQGQVWIGRDAPRQWPSRPGWSVLAYVPQLDLTAWADALKPLASSMPSASGGGQPAVSRVQVDTDCLSNEDRCLGSLSIDASPRGRDWDVALAGSLLAGRLTYQGRNAQPLVIDLARLRLDGLVPDDMASSAVSGAEAGSLFGELEVAPDAASFPARVGQLPAGRVSIDTLEHQGNRFGPFRGEWRASPERLSLEPLSMTLGEVTASGSLVWEASGAEDSLTRSRLSLSGGDPGTALAALGQDVAVRADELNVDSQLAWPGAPWQFALARSRGSLDIEMRDGTFANVSSPSARVVGLLNVDNLLRRLRLDFSDVTGEGTAFDRVSGSATLYGGILETEGPVTIDGPATNFTLDGAADLARRQLDLKLGVTVPVSNNLPLAAVIAGAPVIGGALFVADKLFGDVIDRVTRIHYQVKGPWTSPQISLESAQ
ncbi:YhdP family phospholipid transporter [Halomonas sp. V046]|uniref:YhdP family phospholipid transporter n=1 Tax=Halomonas sp. V046 TaxID=3459611 RepID=UPI004043BE85